MHHFSDKPFAFSMPTRVVFGRGCSGRAAEEARAFGETVLFVTMEDIPCAERIRASLAGSGLRIIPFVDVQPNPLAHKIDEAAALARARGVDVVVAVGGGSVMDTGKGAAIGATHDGSIWEYCLDYDGPRRSATSATLPVIAIPTTAGTGSEVSGIAVIGNAETRQKGPVRSPHIFPRVALVDPDLTLTLPPRLTASTGFDAFSHALERYLSVLRHPLVDSLAQPAMRLVVENLEAAVHDGSDVGARVALSWASTQAIMAVAAQVGESGLHILGLPLSAQFGVSHGESLAVLMPELMRDVCVHLPDRARWIANLLGAEAGPGMSGQALCEVCVDATVGWLKRIGLDRRLSDYGVTPEACETLAQVVNLSRFGNTFYGARTLPQVRDFYQRVLVAESS